MNAVSGRLLTHCCSTTSEANGRGSITLRKLGAASDPYAVFRPHVGTRHPIRMTGAMLLAAAQDLEAMHRFATDASTPGAKQLLGRLVLVGDWQGAGVGAQQAKRQRDREV